MTEERRSQGEMTDLNARALVRRVDQSIAEAIEEGVEVERLARTLAEPVSAVEERAERHRRRQLLRVVKSSPVVELPRRERS